MDVQKDKDIVMETYLVNQEAANNFSGAILISDPLTIPITISDVLRCAAKKKIKYGEVWGLARQAAQLAVEHDNHNEIIGWLKEFINWHKKMTMHIRLVLNQDSEMQVFDDKENIPEKIENPSVS